MTLFLSLKLKKKLIEHSLAEKPLEACGILAGSMEKDNYQVTVYYPMNNTEKSAVSFFMDPKEQIAVFKTMREKGEELVGVFHSHPHSRAYPSAKDVSMAYYPESLYVILSLENKEPVIRAFAITEGVIKEAEVKYSQEPLANSQ